MTLIASWYPSRFVLRITCNAKTDCVVKHRREFTYWLTRTFSSVLINAPQFHFSCIFSQYTRIKSSYLSEREAFQNTSGYLVNFHRIFYKKELLIFLRYKSSQAEIMKVCRLWRSVKCWSNVEDRLLFTKVSTMLGNNWPNLIPTMHRTTEGRKRLHLKVCPIYSAWVDPFLTWFFLVTSESQTKFRAESRKFV